MTPSVLSTMFTGFSPEEMVRVVLEVPILAFFVIVSNFRENPVFSMSRFN